MGDQAQPFGAVTTSLGAPANQSLPMDDHLHVTHNSYCTDIHGFDEEEGDDQLGLSQSIRMLFMISLLLVIRASFFIDLEERHTPLAPYIVIDSFNDERVAISSRDFSLIMSRKYRNTHRRMRSCSSTPID